MICPIQYIKDGPEFVGAECDQAQCAWWDVHREECAILGIAYRLSAIAEAVRK